MNNTGDGIDEENSDLSYYTNSNSIDNGGNGFECDGCFYEWYEYSNSFDNGHHGIAVDDDDATGAGDFYIGYNYAGYNQTAGAGIRVQSANDGYVGYNYTVGHNCDLDQETATGTTWQSNTYTTRCHQVPAH